VSSISLQYVALTTTNLLIMSLVASALFRPGHYTARTVVAAVVNAVVFGLETLWLERTTARSAVGAGIVAGLVYGLVFRYVDIRRDRIVLVEALRWSPGTGRSAARGLRLGLVGGLGLTLFFGVVILIVGNLEGTLDLGESPWLVTGVILAIVGLVVGLVFGLATAVVGAYVGALHSMLVHGEIDSRMSPNLGIRRSIARVLSIGAASIVVATAAFLPVFVAGEAVERFANGTYTTAFDLISEAFLWASYIANLSASIAAFTLGGEAVISHLVLRLCLWWSGTIPLGYVRFLDHATERILMRRVGGGYTFVHRLVQEHFADREAELIPRVGQSAAPQPPPLASLS
jgi:hypothetical protein